VAFFVLQLLNFTILIANIGSGMGAQLAAARGSLTAWARTDALPRIFGKMKRSGTFPQTT